jgi:molybdopterin-guanine dinucleotide biosynthesis protein A
MDGHKDFAGFILAGGRSSRMGRDKATLEINGVTMIDRAVALLRSVGLEAVVIGSPAEFTRRVDSRAIADDWPGAGPLGGIATALRHTQSPWNLVLACDMPYLRKEWLKFLLDRAQAASSSVDNGITASGAKAPEQSVKYMPEPKLRPPDDPSRSTSIQPPGNPTSCIDGIVPMNEDGAEPMCAMYHKRAEAAIRTALENGIRKVTEGLTKLNIEYVEREEWKGFDSEGFLFKNMNEPADYEEAKARWSRATTK